MQASLVSDRKVDKGYEKVPSNTLRHHENALDRL